jgi:hypothetical protein
MQRHMHPSRLTGSQGQNAAWSQHLRQGPESHGNDVAIWRDVAATWQKESKTAAVWQDIAMSRDMAAALQHSCGMARCHIAEMTAAFAAIPQHQRDFASWRCHGGCTQSKCSDMADLPIRGTHRRLVRNAGAIHSEGC